MTKTTQRIAEIADKLSPGAQRALLDIAESLSRPTSFFASMTQDQLDELEQSITEAQRGDVTDQADFDKHLDRLFAKKA